MRRVFGEVQTLRQAVVARRLLWILCTACGHTMRSDPRDLVHMVGGDKSFADLAARSRCLQCGKKGRAAFIINDRPDFSL